MLVIMKKDKTLKNVIAIALIVFALATIFMSSAVLLDWFNLRDMEGNYIPFLEKTNLTAGFLYLVAVYGFIKFQKWSFWALLSITLLLFYALILAYVHIHTSRHYEKRTIIAMTLRILLTLILAGFVYYLTQKKPYTNNDENINL